MPVCTGNCTLNQEKYPSKLGYVTYLVLMQRPRVSIAHHDKITRFHRLFGGINNNQPTNKRQTEAAFTVMSLSIHERDLIESNHGPTALDRRRQARR